MTGRDRYLLVQANAARIPLPDGCVQAVCTSPPYWGLRSYLPTGDSLKSMELGLEETPDCGQRGADGCGECYVCHMVGVFREVKRVLRNDGMVWLNLGDSYAYASGYGSQGNSVCWRPGNEVKHEMRKGHSQIGPGLKTKDLVGIPWRVALALQADGWWIRSAPPWIKWGSAMPESVTSRPTTAHESIFLLTKRADYYWDNEAVRMPNSGNLPWGARTTPDKTESSSAQGRHGDRSIHRPMDHDDRVRLGTNGRNRRTSDFFLESLDERILQQRAYLAHLERIRQKGGMLSDEDGDPLAFLVNPQAFKGAHFATFPRRLVEPMLRAGTSERGCCPTCGGPWVRVTESHIEYTQRIHNGTKYGGKGQMGNQAANRHRDGHIPGVKVSETLGWSPSCSCPPADPVPCIVMDPFNGAGTVGVVAMALGLRYVGFDLSREYLCMSARRISRPHAGIAPPTAGDEAEDLPLFRKGGDGS